MPLVKRTVEPVYIGRAPLDKQVKNELEGVVVNSLAGVIKQLSSISKHAENLFGDLVNEANAIYQRSTDLNKRVEVLYHKTSQLDSGAKEEVRVEDFTFQNHFKSNRKEEQQVLARSTLPLALQEVYKRCEPPPDLNKFTAYRDDGKEGLKFYTDPNYFYDLWVQSQKQLLEKKKKKGKKNRKRKTNKPGKQVKQVTKRVYHAVDKEFISEPGRAPPPPPSDVNSQQEKHTVSEPVTSTTPEQQHLNQAMHTPPTNPTYPHEHYPAGASPTLQHLGTGPSNAQLAAPTVPPPPPPPLNIPAYSGELGVPPPPPPPPPGPVNMAPPPPVQMMSGSPQLGNYPQGVPPPAPPPTGYNIQYQAPPPPPMQNNPNVPPPPMPPMMMAGPPPPPPPSIQAVAAPAPAKPVDDSRSALLSAIEMGKKLRKVERNDEVKQREYGSDVASILARRIVIEVSDTESDSEGSDSSDAEWSD